MKGASLVAENGGVFAELMGGELVPLASGEIATDTSRRPT